MKIFRRLRRWSSKSSVWIAIHVLALLLVLALYCADVFIYKNPPTEHGIESLVVVLVLTVSLCRIVQRQKSSLAAIEKIYADKIGNAFEKDKPGKKLLLSALIDYNNEKFVDCIKKLTECRKKASTVQERQVTKYFTAMCLKNTGKPAAAVKLYHEILQENPAYAPALSNLSVIYFEMKNYPKAIELAEKALGYNRENPFAHQNLASAHFQLYDLEKAKKYALRALELKKNLYQAAALLAIIYSVEGEVLQAKRYMDLAVSSGQNPEELKAAIQEYQKQYAHHAAVEARIADWKNRTGIPSIHFTLDGKIVKSMIGGQINEPAPVSSSGEKMRLLAAIFCSELPANDIFPNCGVIRFYIVPNNGYGAGFDEQNQQKGFRVLFDPEESKFSTSDYSGAGDEPFPVYGSYRPRFTLETDAMPFSDFRFEDMVAHSLEDGEDEEMTPEDYHDDDFIDGLNTGGHKLGGYPCFTQYDPRENSAEYSKYDTLLLQIDSDYSNGDTKVMFGDSGVCNFFIPGEKLKNRDFSDILYTWDCY